MRILLAMFAAALLSWVSAYAADIVPRSAEADTVRRQAESIPLLPKESTVSTPPKLAVDIPAGAENIHLVLKELDIEGSTVYAPRELAEIYQDLIGKDITAADIYIVAAKITQKYTNDHYVLSLAYLPPQETSNGIAKIKITEGYIKNINWKGEELDSEIAHNMAGRLLKLRPLKSDDLEEIMLELNELPSVDAKAALAPAAEHEPGAVDVEITIARKHISAQVDINNYASRYLGVWQSDAQADIMGLLTGLDHLSLNYSTSVDGNYSRYMRAEYGLALNSYGTMFKIGASKSRSAPGYKLKLLDVRSDAENEYFGFSQPLVRARDESLTVSSQFNINAQETDVLGDKLYKDRLRTLQISGVYNRADNWDGVNLLSLDFFKGLNILNATETGSQNLSRPNGHSDFSKLTFSVSRLQGLGSNFSTLVSANGQWSNSPLLSSEEFGYGGSSFGRAYDPSELTGDEGVAGSAELRYDQQIGDDASLQPYLFYDFGEVWSKTDNIDSVSGASAGGGMRLQAFNALRTDLFIAWPLTYVPATPKLGEKDKDPRIGVSMTLFY